MLKIRLILISIIIFVAVTSPFCFVVIKNEIKINKNETTIPYNSKIINISTITDKNVFTYKINVNTKSIKIISMPKETEINGFKLNDINYVDSINKILDTNIDRIIILDNQDIIDTVNFFGGINLSFDKETSNYFGDDFLKIINDNDLELSTLAYNNLIKLVISNDNLDFFYNNSNISYLDVKKYYNTVKLCFNKIKTYNVYNQVDFDNIKEVLDWKE